MIFPFKSKRVQCKAISDSTGEQCQNNFRTSSQRRYCWLHQPKRNYGLGITSLIIGGLLGVTIDKTWDYFIPSRESNQIDNVGSTIIKGQINRSLLDNDIKNLTLILDLNDSLSPDKYIYDGFLIRMSNPVRLHSRLETLVEVRPAGNNQTTFWAFQPQFIVHDLTGTIRRMGDGASSYINKTKSIPIPINLRSSSLKPFNKLIDLDEFELELFLPESIAKSVSGIRLVANSGYLYKKFILIFDHKVSTNTWVHTDYELDNNYKYKLETHNKHVKSQTAWIIDKNLFKEIETNDTLPFPIILDY